MKAIVLGIGFLAIGLVVDKMLEKLGIELEFWVYCVIFGIGIACIIYGILPSKAKNWSEGQIQVLVYPPFKKTQSKIRKLFQVSKNGLVFSKFRRKLGGHNGKKNT